MNATTVRQPPVLRTWDAEKFRYGWRFVRVTRPDGTEDLEQVPLTLEDVLHPQERDVVPERPIQESERGDVARVFRTRLNRLQGGLVLSDCLVDWNVPGVRNHSPDVSVFERLRRQPPLNIGTFRLAVYGGRCILALEIVSPDTRVNDVERKFEEYYSAKVPLYIIVDQERENAPRQLRAYRRGRKAYRPVPLDEQGRVRIDALGLLLGMHDGRLVCYDADTGEELGDYQHVTEARQREAEARQAAERQTQREANARQAAEQRVRELEAELRRLQSARNS